MQLTEFLNLKNLKIRRSIGDGHCLLYSILSSLTQTDFLTDLSTLKSHIVVETSTRADYYGTFISQNENLSMLLSGYLQRKEYTTSFGDLLPSIISNALKINLNIINQTGSTFHLIKLQPTTGLTSKTVNIHRTGDHYNGLVGRMDAHRQQPRPVVIHSTRQPANDRPRGRAIYLQKKSTALKYFLGCRTP